MILLLKTKGTQMLFFYNKVDKKRRKCLQLFYYTNSNIHIKYYINKFLQIKPEYTLEYKPLPWRLYNECTVIILSVI